MMAEISRASKHAKLDRARCFSSAYPFVRSGRERKKICFFRFSRFLQGKGMQKQKRHACVRAEKGKKSTIFPFFAGKRYAEKKCQHMRSGRERKQDFFDFTLFSRRKGL
jgi:hypothetical protein